MSCDFFVSALGPVMAVKKDVSFNLLYSAYRDKGMPDNYATRGLISSIFSGMVNLGYVVRQPRSENCCSYLPKRSLNTHAFLIGQLSSLLMAVD